MITKTLSNGTPMSLNGMATKFIATPIVKQTIIETEDRKDLSCCCNRNLVLAGGVEDYQNDKNSFLYKANITGDTITYTLQNHDGTNWNDLAAITDNTYGTFSDLGSIADYPLYIDFKIEWLNVLNAFGEGNYRLKIARTLIGVSDTLYSNSYYLKTYSTELADRTVLIEWYQNGNIINGIDYSGLNWYQSLRLRGIFGNEQIKKEEENWKDTKYNLVQMKSELKPTYELITEPIYKCVADDLINMVQGNTIYITDYNRDNYSYEFLQKAVKIDDINEIKYNNMERTAIFRIVFSLRTEDNIKINC